MTSRRRLRRFAAAAALVVAAATAVAARRQEHTHPAEDAEIAARLVPPAATPLYEQTEGHRRMLAALRELIDRSKEEHFYLSEGRVRALREAAARLAPDAPDVVRWELYVRLGEEEQRLGNERAALDALLRAYEILPSIEADLDPGWHHRLLFRLGLAYLRRGETVNCALETTPESCLLPIRGRGVHRIQEPSRKAMELFAEVARRAPPGSEPALASLWLLNIAAMTVGAYPDEVPPDLRIPPEAFASDEPFPRFVNVARRAGVDTFSLSGGAVAEDFDGDGYLDLLVSSYHPAEQVRLFINDEDGTFTERTHEAGLTGIYGGLNMVQGDFDDDGDPDVLVLRGAWLGKGGRHPNSLLRNNGDGTFTDVTFDVGLGEVHYPTQTASWTDYDHDGDLDLYVGNETHDGLAAPCQLFENRGDGTFEDVAAAAGVTNDRFTKAVVWGDADGDGWPDLYVSNLDEPNRLYRNRGDGTFEDLAPALGVTGPETSFPAWFWDVDNDGRSDLFVSAYEAQILDLARFYRGEPYRGERARVYRRTEDGRFEDVALRMGLDEPSAPMGSNFGDLDGDGFLDFYLGTGYPPYYALMPNLMYRNRGGTGFANVTTAGGFGHLQKGHAVVFFDYDHDGDQDVFEQMGGALAGDRYHDVLYENPGFGHRWIAVELAGTRSDRSAIGARIHVRIREGGRIRSVYKRVTSGGSFGANPLRQNIGLGDAEAIERLEVYWPTTGRTERFENVPLDRFVHIREGSGTLTVLPLLPER